MNPFTHIIQINITINHTEHATGLHAVSIHLKVHAATCNGKFLRYRRSISHRATASGRGSGVRWPTSCASDTLSVGAFGSLKSPFITSERRSSDRPGARRSVQVHFRDRSYIFISAARGGGQYD